MELPGDITIFDIDWFSIYDVESRENYGSVIVPSGLNVPPSLVKIIVSLSKLERIYLYLFDLNIDLSLLSFIFQPRKIALPNCYQLHKDLQVGWEVFGPQITIQLAGQMGTFFSSAFSSCITAAIFVQTSH